MQNRLTPEACKAARTAVALSQARVATDLGINRTYLSQFESGKYRLDDTTLTKLNNYFAEKIGLLTKNSAQTQIRAENAPEATDDIAAINQELEELRSSIASLCAHDLDNSRFLGLWIDQEEAEKRANEVLCLIARAYFLIEELNGNDAIIMHSEETPEEKTLVIHYVREKLTSN